MAAASHSRSTRDLVSDDVDAAVADHQVVGGVGRLDAVCALEVEEEHLAVGEAGAVLLLVN